MSDHDDGIYGYGAHDLDEDVYLIQSKDPEKSQLESTTILRLKLISYIKVITVFLGDNFLFINKWENFFF